MIEIDVVIRLINAHWRFDSNQEPRSTWHEKADLLELLREFKAKQEPTIGSNGITDLPNETKKV